MCEERCAGHDSPTRRLHTRLALLVIIALLILLVAKILATATLFAYPGEVSWTSAMNVYVARRVMDGGEIYADWRERPHVVALYGPLLYAVPAYVGRVIGADEERLFLIGRWISLMSAVGTAGLIVCVLRARLSVNLMIAGAMGLLFFTTDSVLFQFDMTFRADAPRCFFLMLGLTMAVGGGRTPALLASLIAFLIAFLYKQSAIAGPISVVLLLWLSGRRKGAVYYGLLCAVCFGGVVALLEAITDGRFLLNTLVGLKGNTTLHNIPSLLAKVSGGLLLPATVALFAVAEAWFRWEWNLVTILFPVTLILAAVSTYRDGAGPGYYIVPLATACVACGWQLDQWFQNRASSPAASAALTVTLLAAAVTYVPKKAVRGIPTGRGRSY